MLITAITHASARSKDYNFRGLTAEGAQESISAAMHYQNKSSHLSIPFGRIVSSPKPRCLETAIIFGRELDKDAIHASTVDVDPGLVAGEIEGDELARIGREGKAGHVLVAGHADLSKALPENVALVDDATSDGWFQMRPVMFQIEIDPHEDWSEARVRFCEAFVDGEWQSLLRDEIHVPEA